MTVSESLLSGSRAIVTAGGGGIGMAIAATLKACGAKVAVCDIDDSNFATMLETGAADYAERSDVSRHDEVAAFVERAALKLGGIDILVNNAGIAGPNGAVEEIDPAEWDETIRVDLNSVFYASRAAIPHLVKNPTGSIVNIASSAAFFGYPLRSPYAAAKWGIIGLTKTMAMELGPRQIRVNAICPGSVSGERIDRVMAAEAASRGCSIEDVKNSYTKHTSLKTFVEKEDVAAMITFLCSKAGARISGQAIGLDGHTESLTQY